MIKGVSLAVGDMGLQARVMSQAMRRLTAAPHLKALTTGVQGAMKDADEDSYLTSGDPQSIWIEVDYVDMVVYVFSPEARAYDALEKLWKDAKPL